MHGSATEDLGLDMDSFTKAASQQYGGLDDWSFGGCFYSTRYMGTIWESGSVGG